ncbi:hypothetical protein V7094_25575 [Priestia megaterium]|uniref:hypothetical protein n=1 Tax=Priestia megaterium TaxID=1404 RepID=UPI0030004A46
MTTKTINVSDKKVSEIEKGTFLKKGRDMYIVAKVSEAQFSSVVEDSLFSPKYNNSHNRATYATYGERGMAQRNPAEAKYVLISLSTGLKYYPEFLKLNELLMRVTNAGFEVVSSVEITEVN